MRFVIGEQRRGVRNEDPQAARTARTCCSLNLVAVSESYGGYSAEPVAREHVSLLSVLRRRALIIIVVALLTGGVRTPSDALAGPFAVAALRSVHVDLVFVGVHGMDPRSGFTCPNLLEADTDRALIDAGRRLVVVADHSKWGVIGISSIARLDQADVLITDAGISPEARVILSDAVRELIVVDPGASTRVALDAAHAN